MGPVGWVLDAAQILPFTPIMGKLGLFEAPDDVLATLRPHFSPSLVAAQRQLDL